MMKNANNAVFPYFHLLAEFFEGKGDAPLSHAEVTVCMEWLACVTETPNYVPTAFSTKRLMTTHLVGTKLRPEPKANASTTKQMIKDLLLSSGKILGPLIPPQPNHEPKSQPSEAMVSEKPDEPLIITRTAKTILDVLEGRLALKPSQKKTADDDKILKPRYEDKPIEPKGNKEYPIYSFDIGEKLSPTRKRPAQDEIIASSRKFLFNI